MSRPSCQESLLRAKVIEFEFVFGGSILLSRRFLLSLVVALSLSALASANSATVNATSLHSGTSVYDRAYTYPNHFSMNGGKAMPVMLDASNHRISTGESWNAQGSGLISGNGTFGNGITGYRATPITFLGGRGGTSRYRVGNWVVWKQGTPLSTPEPTSLLLLSTGLAGIAGVMRRKLFRG
jgi:hypothetical protein